MPANASYLVTSFLANESYASEGYAPNNGLVYGRTFAIFNWREIPILKEAHLRGLIPPDGMKEGCHSLMLRYPDDFEEFGGVTLNIVAMLDYRDRGLLKAFKQYNVDEYSRFREEMSYETESDFNYHIYGN